MILPQRFGSQRAIILVDVLYFIHLLSFWLLVRSYLIMICVPSNFISSSSFGSRSDISSCTEQGNRFKSSGIVWSDWTENDHHLGFVWLFYTQSVINWKLEWSNIQTVLCSWWNPSLFKSNQLLNDVQKFLSIKIWHSQPDWWLFETIGVALRSE